MNKEDESDDIIEVADNVTENKQTVCNVAGVDQQKVKHNQSINKNDVIDVDQTVQKQKEVKNMDSVSFKPVMGNKKQQNIMPKNVLRLVTQMPAEGRKIFISNYIGAVREMKQIDEKKPKKRNEEKPKQRKKNKSNKREYCRRQQPTANNNGLDSVFKEQFKSMLTNK